MFVGCPEDPKAWSECAVWPQMGMGTHREGLLSGLAGGLGLRGGWAMYKRYISLPKNRKNPWKTGVQLDTPAILPGSR